jgi:heat-inducible transcriptional repressor
MNKRQEQLLNLVVENHISTAEPVGSKFLVSEAGLKLSEATVRNELRVLEEEGFLTHPHTSAGRMPTVSGYKYYISNNDFSKSKLSSKEQSVLNESKKGVDEKEGLKNFAKDVVEISGQTVLIAFSRNSVYYTGLANLFSQPEVEEMNLSTDLSSMFDRCEECVSKFYDIVADEPKFYVSDEHSFGEILSVGAFRFGDDSIFAMLGPVRMDYKKNYAILSKAKEKI